MVAADTIQDVVNSIVRAYNPEQVILFGSYAWGEPSADSDVDLCIIKKSKKNRREREFELRKKLYPPPAAIDLLILTPDEVQQRVNMGDFFMRNIVTKGKKLYDVQGSGR